MAEVTPADLEKLDQELADKYAARFKVLKEKEKGEIPAVVKLPEEPAVKILPPEVEERPEEQKPRGKVLTQKEIEEQFAAMKQVKEPTPQPAEPEPQVQSAEVTPAVIEPVAEVKAREAEPEFPVAQAEVSAEEIKVPETEPERRKLWQQIFKRAEKPAEEIAKEVTPEEVDKTVEAAVKVDAKAEFQKMLEQANLTAQERKSYEAILKNKNWFDKTSESLREKLRYTKILGFGMDAVVGMTGAGLVRWGIRNTLKSVLGPGFGVGIGAAIGGGFGGYRAYRKAAAEQYAAGNWLQELESKNNLELAQQHDVLFRALAEKKVKGKEKEALQYVLKLRDIETKLATLPEAKARKSLKEQADEQRKKELDNALEKRDKALGNNEMEGKRKDIYQEMLSVRKSHIKGKMYRGIIFGAAAGGVGSAIGAWLGEHVNEFFSGGPTQAVKEAVKAPTKEMVKEVTQQRSQAMLAVVENAAKNLPNEDFTMHARAGEGLTHVARSFIHDYLVEQHQLMPGQKVVLSQEQLVYAEDFLRRQLENHVQPGEVFHTKGQEIVEALGRAQNLTQGQLQNLQENWVGKISEKTWQQILDYSQTFESANNFAVAAKERALAQAEKIGTQVLEAAQAAKVITADQIQTVVHEATQEAAKEEGKDKTLSYILGGVGGVAGIVGLGAAAAWYRRRGRLEALDLAEKTPPQDFIARPTEAKKIPEVAKEQGETKAAEVDLDKISKELEQKYGIITVASGGQSRDENTLGLQKIGEVLGGLSEEERKKLTGIGFEIGKKNKVSDMGWFEIDFSKKPEELQKFIRQNLPEVGRIARIKKESNDLRVRLENLTHAWIYSHVSGDNEWGGLNRLQEALKGKGFEQRVEIHLVPPAGHLRFKEGINLDWNLPPREMRAEIEKYLTSQKEHKPA